MVKSLDAHTPSTAGTFSMASDDVLKNRPIKKAKRRTAGAEGESGGALKVFKGFSLAPTSGTGPATGGTTGFSGFGNGSGFKPLSGLYNGNSTAPVTPAFSGFASSAANKAPTAGSLTFNSPSSAADVVSPPPSNGSAPASSPCQSSNSISTNSKEYSRQLTALNCSVRDWITKHVNGNPLCDLNPIFRDYEKHLASIERRYGGGGGSGAAGVEGGAAATPGEKPPASAAPPPSSSSSSTVSSVAIATAAPALFSFSKEDVPAAAPESSPVPAGIRFNFAQKVDSSVLGSLASRGAAPSFSFSSTSSSTSLFGGAAPPAFSFSGAKAEAVPIKTDENGEEESDEPPKVEVKEIKEKDAFYSKKCKLFYKKDAEFKEKGVGTLHLKTTPEGKIQLLVRADTNLGNILLNIMLQTSMPCSRMGKNNVMVVCVPNPAIDERNPTTPVPMLIRVKTAQDADELHKILEDKKA
uniref:Nuclear pore complex protein Nup50 n=1 Tax=Esox lucius TaxID=8010 RepID=A0A3P8XVH0_ESOLU